VTFAPQSRDICPRCRTARLRRWADLTDEEREVLRRLPAAAEFTLSDIQGVALVMPLGPNRGKVRVRVDNGEEATEAVIDLYAPTVQPRRVVFADSSSSGPTVTVTLEVLAERNPVSTGRWVSFDALVVLVE
jgi:hypothetical protein